MAKASLPDYRKARSAVFKALAAHSVDGCVPDDVRFRNEGVGITLRMSSGEKHIQRLISWGEVATSHRDAAMVYSVESMLEQLARADAQ